MTANERATRVRGLYARGFSPSTIARTLGVSRRTVGRVIRQLDQGLPSAPQRAGHTPEVLILLPTAQTADRPPIRGIPGPPSEVEREPSDTPATPSGEPPQAPASPPIGDDRR
jgi:Homeodomain-like domain